MTTTTNQTIKTLLFDYGGTLDTGACHWAYVLEDGYRYAGLTLDNKDFRSAYVYAERALAKNPVIQPTDNFKQLLLKKIDLEFEYLETNHLMHFPTKEERAAKVESVASYCDGFARSHVEASREVLDALRQKGYRLLMVSNFYGNLHTILEAYSIAHLFDEVIESAVVGVRKPSPAIWKMGVESAGCLPQEAIAIGDSFGKDIEPAHEAGCHTIWYKGREWEDKAYDESLPDHIITDLRQLQTLL